MNLSSSREEIDRKNIHFNKNYTSKHINYYQSSHLHCLTSGVSDDETMKNIFIIDMFYLPGGRRDKRKLILLSLFFLFSKRGLFSRNLYHILRLNRMKFEMIILREKKT